MLLISREIISFNASYFAIANFLLSRSERGWNRIIYYSTLPPPLVLIHPFARFFAHKKDIYGYDFYCSAVPSIRREGEGERYGIIRKLHSVIEH